MAKLRNDIDLTEGVIWKQILSSNLRTMKLAI